MSARANSSDRSVVDRVLSRYVSPVVEIVSCLVKSAQL